MSKESIFKELANSVLTFDVEKVIESTKKALDRMVDPAEVIDKGLSEGLKIVGNKFENGELFLTDLVTAGEAVKKVMADLLEPAMLKDKASRKKLGKIVLGTVAGDIHDIGKDIVGAMLFVAGFEVYDLGKDVPVNEFVKKAKEVDADVIASSALLSTTMPVQREIVKALKDAGIRERVKVIVGGAPVTSEWAEEIGADGYGENAIEAVYVTKKLLKVT